jgi:hypothetical protein
MVVRTVMKTIYQRQAAACLIAGAGANIAVQVGRDGGLSERRLADELVFVDARPMRISQP